MDENKKQEIIDNITPILKTGDKAGFKDNSLYVACHTDIARIVHRKLEEIWGEKRVVTNVQGGGFVFDFI